MTVQTLNNDENNRGDKIKNEAEKKLRSLWLGMRDSNPRILVPETSALPLGESPMNVLLHQQIVH
jgi:hypothetical protein